MPASRLGDWDSDVGYIVDALASAPHWMWQELLSICDPAPYYGFLLRRIETRALWLELERATMAKGSSIATASWRARREDMDQPD